MNDADRGWTNFFAETKILWTANYRYATIGCITEENFMHSRYFFRLVLTLAVAVTCLSGRADSSDDTMRNTRMNACVKLLRQNDKALQNAWKGHCGIAEVGQEIGGGAPDGQIALAEVFAGKETIVVPAGGSCTDAVKPVATTAKCGLASPALFPNLESGAAMRVRMPGNTCGAFIPILFTNKTDFACNAVQSRIACVDVSHDANTDRTTIKFSTRRDGPAETTTIEFGAAELAQHDGRIGDLISHPQFAIVPELSGGDSLTKKILDATRAQEKDCIDNRRHAPAECTKRARFQADANMQEAIRRFRNPRHDSPKPVIVKDGEIIVAFLRSKQIDKIPEQWMLFLSIAANEVGLELKDDGVHIGDPIYGISDAVVLNSGLTFGAHQIDLGANEDRELKVFWDVINAYKAAHPDAVLDKAAAAKDCVDLPLRLMTVGALALTYQAAPRMTVATRSAEGIDEYNKRLQKYLAEEVQLTGAKPGLFKKSMITRILFSDLKNQGGSGSRIQKLADAAVADGTVLNSCQSIAAAENDMLHTLIFNDPDDHSKGKTQFAIRYENIKRIVRDRVAKGGISGCS